MILENLQTILLSGYVRRCHNIASDAAQTNGHHSWGVAVILQYIYPECSKAALLQALYHDVPEVITGDVPATAKWMSDKLQAALAEIEEVIEKRLDISVDLDPVESAAVKLADSLDLLLYSRHRVFMGDRNFEGFITRLMERLTSLHLDKFPKAKELIYA